MNIKIDDYLLLTYFLLKSKITSRGDGEECSNNFLSFWPSTCQEYLKKVQEARKVYKNLPWSALKMSQAP